MKIYRILLIVLITLSNLSLACELKKLKGKEGEKFSVCYERGKTSYYSEECRDLSKCFPLKGLKLQTYPNQSPGFSLCYQLGGEPFFSKRPGTQITDSFCLKEGKVADHESLLNAYFEHKK